VFEDDIQIKEFMQVQNENTNQICDEEDENNLVQKNRILAKMIQLKTNTPY